MIPKIIHQIWLGSRKRPSEHMETWPNLHAGWQYIFWDEQAIKAYFPDGLINQDHFDYATAPCAKADILRYEILLKFGGIYIDADTICLRPLDDQFLSPKVWATFENEKTRGDLLANGFIGAETGNNFIELMVKDLSKRCNFKYTNEQTEEIFSWLNYGPVFLTESVSRYNPDISVFPSYYFIPNHYTGVSYDGPGKPYGDHDYSHESNTTYKE
tara:strand:- start:704 stop:1345 length:642 start_codon:yes stop_codon:yes gene_type:complete